MISVLYFDFIAFILDVILLCSVYFHRLNHGRTNRIFVYLLIIICVESISNFVSLVLLKYGSHSEITRVFANLFRYAFYSAHIIRMPVCDLYIFSSSGIWQNFKRNPIIKGIFVLLVLVPFIHLFANILTGAVFFIDENYVIHYGVEHYVIYAYWYLAMVYGFGTMIIHRNLISKRKSVIGFSIFPLTIFATTWQMLNHQVMLESFIVAISAFLMSISMESSENQMDPVLPIKRFSAFDQHLKNCYASHRHEFVVLVKIINILNIKSYIGQENYFKFIIKIAKKLMDIDKKFNMEEDVFYLFDGNYAITTETMDEKTITNFVNEINEYLDSEFHIGNFSILAETKICIVNIPEDLDSKEKCLSFCNTYFEVMPGTNNIRWLKDFSNTKDFKIRMDIDQIIDRALESNNFEMYYQPIYSMEKKRFIAAEAFVRLNDPEWGYISPKIFLNASERTGKIYQIGDIVLNDVCKFISDNRLENLGLEHIEINLAASQCAEKNLVNDVMSILSKYNISADKIRFEITENIADNNPLIIEENIRKLTENGIKFSLDDYGVGYSNIKKIVTLPFEIVKLDKTFVDQMENPQMWIIIQDTIRMLKEMEKSILIEGIEEGEVIKAFAAIGCDMVQGCEFFQGYFFSKPLPKEEFISFIKNKSYVLSS